MSSENLDDIELGDPPEVDPYEVLGLDKTATPDQIKSAYRKAALKHHPDKAKPEDKSTAHTTFQRIALSYAILSDPSRRSLYDSTGRTDDSLSSDPSFSWSEYYRSQYHNVVSTSSIAAFTAEYKGSEEEREALLDAYTAAKGDMGKIYEKVMVSDPGVDDQRFRDVINAAIQDGQVEAYDKFTKESKKSIRARIAAAKEEGKEAEDYAKELGVHDKLFGEDTAGKGKAKKGGKKNGSEDALAALIQQRQNGRAGDFLAGLEAKYGGGKKRGKREQADDEPSEEAFAAMAKRAKKEKTKQAEDEPSEEAFAAMAKRGSKKTKKNRGED